MKRKKSEKVIALVLSMLMVFSMMPASVFAGVAENAKAAEKKGVIVSIENYETGEFVLEPVRVENNGSRIGLIKAAFEASGIKNAVVEEKQFDWSLDIVTNIQGIVADDANGSSDIGNRAWMLFKNNSYELFDYTNWKNTQDNTVIRLVYTTNKGVDCGFTGATSDKGSLAVNKDALITALADLKADFGTEEAYKNAMKVATNSKATAEDVNNQIKALQDMQTAPSIPELPIVPDNKGTIVSIENYETGEFVLEPVRVENNGSRIGLIKAAFEASGIKNAVVEEKQFDWSLDIVTNIQGIVADDANGSSDIGNRAWMLFKNNSYNLFDYTNWKNTQDNTIIRLVYTTNKGVDCGFTGATSDKGSLAVNKDELIRLIADARAKYPATARTIADVENTVLNSAVTTADVEAAVAKLQAAIDESRAAQTVTITTKTGIINVGETFTFEAKKDPVDAIDEIVWSVDDNVKASINAETGEFTANGPGKVKITATAGKVSDSVEVDIKAPAKGLKVDKKTVKVVEKATVKVTATVEPADTTDEIKWTVEDEKVATVAQDGTIKGVKKGLTTVTVTVGGFSETIEVNVKDIPATSIVLDKTSVRIPLRGTEKVSVKKILPEGTTETEVKWISLDDTRATVDQEGNITAGSFPGKTTVIASVGNVKAEVAVEAYRIPTTSITSAKTATVKERGNINLKGLVTVLPVESTDIITWHSLNEDIATVDADGNVTGVKTGKAEIVAKSGDFSTTIEVSVTEGVYVYFDFVDDRENLKIDPATNTIYLSTSDAGGHFRVANYDGKFSFDCDTHTDSTGNDYYFISTIDGKLNGYDGKSKIYIELSETGEKITVNLNVSKSDIKSININVNGNEASESNPLVINGFENGKIFGIEGVDANGEKVLLAPAAVNFKSLSEDKVRVNQDGRIRFVGTGKAYVQVSLKGNEKVYVTAVMDIKPVPLKNFKVNLDPGAKPFRINYWNFLGGYYVGAQPYSAQNDGYTISYEPYNTTEKKVLWKALTPEIATHMEEFTNGIIPKRSGIAKFKVTSAIHPEISTDLTIEFAYKVPLKEVVLNKTDYNVEVSNTVPLDISFIPGNVTEERFDWTYDKEGIVEIQETVIGDGFYKGFTHNILGKKAGIVKVTGTPYDTTAGCKPIEFTVKVGNGGASVSKVTGLEESIKHGMDNLYAPNSAVVGNEWGIFTLARAGHKFTTAEINQYVESVNKSVNKKLANGREPSPTDYATIVLALTSLGQDPRTVCDVNFIEKLYNNKNLRNPAYYTSNMLMWTLLALDSHNYEVPANAANSRDQIIAELLKYQRSNGGFNLVIAGEDDANMLDVTAMAIQALVKYQDKPEVKKAIEKGVEYINKRITPNAGFVNEGDENSCTTAQIIVALAALKVNVLDPNSGFVRNGQNIISRIQKFEREGGFVLIEDGRKADGMSTYQVTYALEAFRRYQNNENTLYDMTDVKLNTDKDAPVEPEVKPEINEETGDVVIKVEGPKAEVAPDVVKAAKDSIIIELTGKTVKYDKSAVAEIQKQLPKDTVKVEVAVEKTHRNDENLTLDQLKSLSKNKKNLGIFEIKLVATNAAGKTTEIHNFGEGTATITVDFENPKNLKLEVVRVENDGTFTRVKSSYANGKLTWVTNGHSYYMVAEAGTIKGSVTNEVINNGNNGSNGNNATDNATNNANNNVNKSPKTGDNANTLGWMLLMMAAVAAVPVARRKFNK